MRVVDFDPRRFYLVMLCKRIVAIVQSVTNADGLPLSASEADIVSIFRSILAIQLATVYTSIASVFDTAVCCWIKSSAKGKSTAFMLLKICVRKRDCTYFHHDSYLRACISGVTSWSYKLTRNTSY